MSYSDKVIDHYENPRNVGTFDKEEKDVGTGMVGAPACGDVMRLQIKVGDDGVIEDAKFKTYGCLASNSKIATPNKYVKVADLNVGDDVWAWNGEKIVKNKVKQITTRSVHYTDLLRIRLDKQGKRKTAQTQDSTIICTKDHIWWSADNRPIEAKDLTVGMELLHMTENELRTLNNTGHENASQSNQKIDQKHSDSTEKAFINLFTKNGIDASYVGNSDFKVNGQRKLIEVYTSKLPTHMMNRSNTSWMIKRKQEIASAGFDSMFIDIAEIDRCLPEVQRFIHNGIKINAIEAINDKRQLRGVERDGDFVTVYDLQLEEGANIYFVDRAMSHNCGSAIASSSLLTEWVKGKTLEEASEIKNAEIAEELALPPVKIHCSVLAESAIKAAIKDYNEKQEDK